LATDASPAAVVLAQANVARLGLGRRVSVHRGDLLEGGSGPLDLVVADLPYLPLTEAWRYADLAGEPPEAIFATGDGLDPYRRLLASSRERLGVNGTLVIQVRRRVLVACRDQLDALETMLEPAGAGGEQDDASRRFGSVTSSGV
jgi:release factor glutamine methyltransferase